MVIRVPLKRFNSSKRRRTVLTVTRVNWCAHIHFPNTLLAVVTGRLTGNDVPATCRFCWTIFRARNSSVHGNPCDKRDISMWKYFASWPSARAARPYPKWNIIKIQR